MKSARVFPFLAGLLPVASALALTLVSTPAAAQSTSGYAVNRFDPAEKGSDWFANESLDLRGHMRPAIGVVGDYSTNQIAYYNYDGSTGGALVGIQTFVHVGASLTLWDRLRLGLNLPFALYQDGASYTYNNTKYLPPSKAALGDIRVGADVRLLGEYKDAFTLAIGAQVHLPTGSEAQFTGDGNVSFVPRILIAGDLADIAYAAKLGIEIRGRNDVFAATQLGNAFTGSVAVGLRGFDRHLLVGPEFFASTPTSNLFSTGTSPVEGLLGAHLALGDWRTGLGLGGGIGDVYSSPSFRMLLGLEWAPAIPDPDRDNDGIFDKDDACPDVAGVKTDDPKTNGCPPDRDHDGILDADDACPDTAGVKTDDPKTNGCPPVIIPKPSDRDGDGIVDGDDACPDVPGVKNDDPKKNGCPPDKDGDGIVDAEDACPDVAGVKSDDPKKNGCPADKDGDGIPDATDACPDVAGIASDDPKKNGCPALAAISNGMIKIMEQVQFKTGSATILPASNALLTAVLGILNDHPEIKKVHIEGHTDNVGAPAMNKTLSDKRAKSVMAWLQLKGVDKKRMDAQGYGQERPIAPNDTDAGKQTNRRVEFHIDNN